MSLFDDLDAMARAQSRREAAAQEVSAAVQRRGRHRAPPPPFWALRPAPRHQVRVTASQASPSAPPPPSPPAHPAPTTTLSPTALDRYARIGRAAADADDAEPVVLVYGDVEEDRRDPRAIAPRRLADHLAVLHATGHRTVGLDGLADHAVGHARLPARSVVVVFEPGARGLHRSADPALAAHGARAVALTADATEQRPARSGAGRSGAGADRDLDLLLASGRWEVVPAQELGFAAPRRLGVTGDLTAAALLAALGEMATLPVADLVPNRVSRSWRDPGGDGAPVLLEDADVAVGAVPAGVGQVVADWAPQRTAGWERYAVEVRVTGLGAGGSGGLRVRVGRVGEVSAALSAGALVLERGAAGRSSHPLARPADEHALRLDVEQGWVTVTVDGREVARVPALDGDHEPRVAASAAGDGALGTVATAGSLGVVARRGADGGFPHLAGLVVSAPSGRSPSLSDHRP